MSLLPSSQLTLTKSNEHLTVIHEDKEELYIPQPLEENISRVRASTFSGLSESSESQIKLSRSSTVYEQPLLKRSSKTLSLRNSQEIAVDNCGSEKLLRQNRTLGSPNLSESPSPRGRRQVRSKSSDVKSQSLPAKEISQRSIDHKRSLSLSTADAKTTADSKKNLISKHSPKKLNVSTHNNFHLKTSIDVEHPRLKEEFSEECYAPSSLNKPEIDKLVNSRIKNRELAHTILAANCEGNQKKKEIYINAILERGVSGCPSLIPLIRTNKQLFHSLVEIQKRIRRLQEHANKHQGSNEFLYYCSRILQALDFLDTTTPDCNGTMEIIKESEADMTPLSFLQTLAGVLESEFFHIQEEQATVLSKQIVELKKLHEIIKNLAPQLKLHISHDKTSLEQKNKKNKFKRYSGTSSNARQTMEFILGKISEITSPHPKTNLLISEIIHLIDQNAWMKAILTNDSNRALNTKFEGIKQALFKFYQLESNHDTHEQSEFWEALLDIPADPVFHKKFITSQHKFTDVLCNNHSVSSTEQLFFLLNEKFAEATPYQRKQILQLALYWLQSPLQIGLRNPNLPDEIDSMELRKARPLIKSLIMQVKNHRCLALYGIAQQLKDASKGCVAPTLTKPDLTHAISPKQLLKSIAAGTCKGSNYELAITNLCKTLRTLCMYGFLNITHAELHKPLRPDEHETSIAGLAKYSSFLSYWVLESIFKTLDEPKEVDLKKEINKRKNRPLERMIEFFIDVCVRLVDEKNSCPTAPADYHTAYAIYVILAKSYVEKLFKDSSAALSISTDRLIKLESLTTLFNSNETFINLRKKYEMVPCHIPAINFICRDLTTSLDPSLVPIIHKEKINLTAINKIGDCTLTISQSQASLNYSNTCVFNLPDEFSRIEKSDRYCNASNKFDDHIFDNIFYSIAHGLLPALPPAG